MKPLVFDSTPLTYTSNVGLSRVFEELKDEKLTSPRVKRKVVDEGKSSGVPDVIVLEKLFHSNLFKVTKPQNKKLLASLLEMRGFI